jgi:hypothetical protein
LTWDNLEKGIGMVQTRCVFFKLNFEYASHLFVSCPYAGQVTMAIKEKLKVGADWNNISLEDCYKLWIQDRSLKLYA